MIKKLSDKIADYLSLELNYDNEKREVLSYGMQIFLGTSIQILSILIIAYFFNIFSSTIIVTTSYVTFRRIIGGSHADTYKKCSFISISLMILLGALGEIIKLNYIGIVAVIILIYILAIAAITIWVPAGTEKKIIKEIDTRKKVKIQAVMLITVWLFICYYLSSLDLKEYAIQSSLGVILAFFQVTPLGYKFINLKVM